MRHPGLRISLLVLGAVGCGGRVAGPTGELFGQRVETYAQLKDGQVMQVVMTLPVHALENAHATPHTGPLEPSMVLEFPPEVQQQTYIQHASIFWEPEGHPPVYQVPHFDLHFFRITPTKAAAIDCQDTTPTDENRLPEGYVLPPPQDPNRCVPLMGLHAAPESDFAPGFVFTKTLVFGYYEGTLDFVEPMVTRDLLMARQTFEMAIPRPRQLPAAGLFPSRFIAEYQQSSDSYDLAFTDFVEAQ